MKKGHLPFHKKRKARENLGGGSKACFRYFLNRVHYKKINT